MARVMMAASCGSSENPRGRWNCNCHLCLLPKASFAALKASMAGTWVFYYVQGEEGESVGALNALKVSNLADPVGAVLKPAADKASHTA
jgi:hypothetical protein